jgi:amino acid adenylation domain-containing protein
LNAAETLLARLETLGVELWVEDGRLRYRAAKGVMDDELLAALRRCKYELTLLLGGDLFAPIEPLARISHTPSTADADLLAVAHRTPSRRLDVGSATPSPPFSPCGAPQRHLDALATTRCEKSGLADRDDYELSHAQRRLWVLDRLEPGSAAYNVPLHQYLEGDLDPAALAAALARLVERHESLRTVFVEVDGEPRQAVRAGPGLEYLDLTAEAEPERAARRLGRQHAMRGFDLAEGPLLRASLLKLAERRHVLLLTVHHIVCDGVSIALLGRDLGELYGAARAGRPPALAPLPIQYRDFAYWQNRLLRSGAARRLRDYWLDKLGGALPMLDLPLDFPRPPLQTFRGEELTFTLDAARSRALAALAHRRRASLFIALLALVKVLLHRYGGQRDILVGSPVAGREHPDLGEQVGCYLNMLVFRDAVDPERPFAEFLEGVRRTALEAYDHGFYPFDRLVEELRPARDLSRSPLFDVTLILQNQEDRGFVFEGLTASPCFEHPGTSKTDLTFCFKETPEGLVLALEYNTDLFRRDRIERLAAHFFTLTDSVLADPERPLGRLNLIPEAERARLLADFNATADTLPDRTVVDGFRERAAGQPDAVAVAGSAGVPPALRPGWPRPQGAGETPALPGLTYGELDRLSDRLAARLRRLGVGPNRPVAVCLDRSPTLLVGLLGILKAGGAYLPLDPAYPQERLAFMLKDSGAALLVTESALADRLPTEGVQVVLADAPEETAEPVGLVPPAPGDLAYVIYTSGSTGTPKGVAVTHGNLMNLLACLSERIGLGPDDTLLAVTTPCFDIAGLELFAPLLAGARILLADRGTAQDGTRLLPLLAAATVMQATPATWRMLLDAGWPAEPRDLTVLCGGEALAADLAAALLARCRRVLNVYGPTETTIWSTVQPVTAADSAQIPIGRPLANTRLYILDPQGEPAPLGVPGELCIGGTGVAQGYLGRPALTAARFVPDPYGGAGARLYRTGDLARYRSDGTVEFLGRGDGQVKIRGFRIELGEIEAALARLPGVAEAAVAVRDDPPDGRRLVAYLVAAAPPDSAELRRRLAESLPDYMVPAVFVTLDRLPLTPNGKVDRKALPAPDRPAGDGAGAPPRDALERHLAEAWQTLLDLPRVGIHDDFFALGGHSLKAVRLIAQLRRDLAAELELVDLFRQPTVAGLAELLRTRGCGAETEAIAPATADELALLWETFDD